MFENNTGLIEAEVAMGNNDLIDAGAGAFSRLFKGCRSLEKVTCLMLNLTSNTWFKEWLVNVSPTGTFVKHPDAVWNSDIIPTNWTVVDANI